MAKTMEGAVSFCRSLGGNARAVPSRLHGVSALFPIWEAISGRVARETGRPSTTWVEVLFHYLPRNSKIGRNPQAVDSKDILINGLRMARSPGLFGDRETSEAGAGGGDGAVNIIVCVRCG